MRKRSAEKSADSSPPVPARISRKMLRSSLGSFGRSFRCSSASSFSRRSRVSRASLSATSLFDDALRIFTSRKPPGGAVELVAPRALRRVAQRAYRRNHAATFEPLHEVAHLVLDDHFRLRDRVLAYGKAFARDLAQVVDAVE